MIARSLRRAADWRSGLVTLEHIVEVEFREAFSPDREEGSPIELSTYEVAEGDELVRISAEHAASVPLRPDRMTWLSTDLALDGIRVRATPVPTEFEFMRQRHRDIVVRDVPTLRDLAAKLRGSDGSASPVHAVEKAQIVSYVRARLEASDAAWGKVLPATWKIERHQGGAPAASVAATTRAAEAPPAPPTEAGQ